MSLRTPYNPSVATSLTASVSSNTLTLQWNTRHALLPSLSEKLLSFRQPDCPVCHIPLTIDLEAPALELEENVPNARQGILGRLNLETWRSSSKIEALVEELTNLRMQDATTKSIVFSQFVNFLDLIAYRLQRAGFNVGWHLALLAYCY